MPNRACALAIHVGADRRSASFLRLRSGSTDQAGGVLSAAPEGFTSNEYDSFVVGGLIAE